jgi:type I restriction enzyme S subunit
VTNGWFTNEIDNLCFVEYGTRVVQKKDGGTLFPVYGGGGATFSIDRFNREDRLTIARFAMSATCTRFVKGKFFLNDSGLTLSPKDSSKISQNFLDYQCLAMNDIFYSLAKGSAQKNLDVPAFRRLKLKIPNDIKAQEKIVAKLDAILAEIDKAVLATEANVKNFEALWQSTIDRVINDFSHLNTPTSFDEIVSIKSKLIDPKEEKFHNFIHIGAANIVSNSDELCELKTAKDEGLISGKFIFDENTILYSKIRPYLKKVAKPSFIGLCSADVYPLVCNEKMMIKDFLFYILLSSDFTKFAISGSDRAGMPKVNRDHLFSYKINLPSISAQIKLTEQINQIKHEVKSSLLMLSKKLDELNLLKKSILRQAFNGELVKD